jgi:hypothetical protein
VPVWLSTFFSTLGRSARGVGDTVGDREADGGNVTIVAVGASVGVDRLGVGVGVVAVCGGGTDVGEAGKTVGVGEAIGAQAVVIKSNKHGQSVWTRGGVFCVIVT